MRTPNILAAEQAASRSNRLIEKGTKMNNRQPLERLLTVGDVADVIGVSKRTVSRWIIARDLRASRLGRQLRVSPTDLIAFIKTRDA